MAGGRVGLALDLELLQSTTGIAFDTELLEATTGLAFDVEMVESLTGLAFDLELLESFSGFPFDLELLPGAAPAEPPPIVLPPATIPPSGKRIWVLNMANREWTFDTGPEVLTLGDNVFDVGAGKTIDQITGFLDNIEALVDSLSGPEIERPILLKGTDSGEILTHDDAETQDWNGAFEFIVMSHDIGHPMLEVTLQELFIRLEATLGGTVVLEASYNRGESWVVFAESELEIGAGIQRIRLTRRLTGQTIHWRFRAISGNPRIIAWWARLHPRRRMT